MKGGAFREAIIGISALKDIIFWKNTEENLTAALQKIDQMYKDPITIVNHLIKNLRSAPQIIGHEVEEIQTLSTAYGVCLITCKQPGLTERKWLEIQKAVFEKMSMKLKKPIIDEFKYAITEKSLSAIQVALDKLYKKNKLYKEVPLSSYDMKKRRIKRKLSEVIVKTVDIQNEDVLTLHVVFLSIPFS